LARRRRPRGYVSTVPLTADDDAFLRRAFELASEARAGGNHPFGALLVGPDGTVLAEALNSRVTGRDATGHAETNLVRLAGQVDADLAGCTLYTSTEPCAMCAGAIYWSGIGRVVFGLSEADLLVITGTGNPDNPTLALPCREVFARGQRVLVVDGPALEAEARTVHDGFWT
jgi:tRNA(Arg) A34 adenosine deaminase TadA